MTRESLSVRVDRLEATVDGLQTLPAQMSTLAEAISAVKEELRREIREGDEETRRYMRVLHEDVITRIATLAEGRTEPPRRPRRKS